MKIQRLDEAIPLIEMAIINPRLCKNKTIQVEVEQRDEGPIPHLHVYHDKTRNPRKCSYICLNKVEYAVHHDVIKLPKALKQEFIDIMTEIVPNQYMVLNDGSTKPANGYQTAVQVWAETYEDGSLEKFNLAKNGEIISIDYSNL